MSVLVLYSISKFDRMVRMRYMLAHMLEGEAKEYHTELADRIAESFNLTPVGRHCDPRISLKAPFETNDVSDVTAAVSAFAMTEEATPFELTGFGSFEGRVVYKDIEAPEETVALVRRLQDQLREISWLQFSSHETPITLHTTISFPRTPEQAKEIMSYLEKEPPVKFQCMLDSISLLHKRERRWEVARTFKLTPQPVSVVSAL